MSEARATYRVQLHPGFGFADVANIAPYLGRLGITHVYCSPYLQAHPGSTHGYDVVDHTRLNQELGGTDAFDHMVKALQDEGLAHIVDIVPNHVSVAGRANSRWWDVLKHGRSSGYAHWFDIDWDPPHDYLKNKVLVPVLGGELEDCLARGELTIAEEEGDWVVRYFEHGFPLAPESLPHGKAPDDVDLRRLLERQHYVLAYWRRGARHLNYRRFFDINTLAALDMDAPGVFEETHSVILGLQRAGRLDGLRVDHIDGLKDPQGYLQRVAEETDGAYVVVEKILEGREQLPRSWPTDGTTGYDFLNRVLRLFMDAGSESAFSGLYTSWTDEVEPLEEMIRAKKFLVMRHILPADVTRLMNQLGRVFDTQGWGWDEDELRVVVAELIAALPVYRTYLRPGTAVTPSDRSILRSALDEGRKRAGHVPAHLFDHLAAIFFDGAGGRQGDAFVARFQQTTGPIMAKGVEDTVFYNYNRFIALNEVGGDPGSFGSSIEDFHRAALETQARRPMTMLATATHDTKRGEDVRARLAALSESPDLWEETLERLSKTAERYKTDDLPDRNIEYFLFQAFLGAWPVTVERGLQYAQKAAREAKRHTSWTDPDHSYEEALATYVRGALNDPAFVSELERSLQPLIATGRLNSLAQTLVKLTHPGCPDIYQGTELWDLSLVDPDNRRPVDHELRASMLERVGAADPEDIDPLAEDGSGKLYVTWKALQVRRRLPDAFGAGSAYEPLWAAGDGARHLVAFERGGMAVTIVPRLVSGLSDPWSDTTLDLAQGRWLNELTGRTHEGGGVPVATLLAHFPVALLTREAGGGP